MQTLNLPAPPASRTRRGLARWMAGLTLGITLALASGSAAAVPPAAGTSIGNQASATYTDSSGISRTVTSNTTQTVVQQVAALTLVSNGAKTATIGGTVYYPHTLTNTGNGTDTFALLTANVAGSAFNMTGIAVYADNGSGAPTGSPLTSVSLAAGASAKLVVAATVPTTATATQTNSLTLTATSGFTTSVNAVDTDTTTVSNNAVIALSKSISASSGPPGGTTQYTYTLSYTNTGNNTATTVKITDAVPAGMTYVSNSALWSVTGAGVTLKDSPATQYGTAPNQITYDFGKTTVGTATAIITNVAPGQSGTITFAVTINANAAAGVINNTAAIGYNDGSGTTVSGTSNTVPFTVTKQAAVAITSNTVASAVLGASFTFGNTVTNNGNTTDTFNISLAAGSPAFPAGTTFQLYKSDGVTPLIDTNGDTLPDTGPLAAGASYTVVVKVTLPATATPASSYIEDITATSTVTSTTSATGVDTLGAFTGGAAVDVTNSQPYGATALGYGAGPEAAAVVNTAVNPGASATFALYVNNRGTVADTYNLSSTLALPAGWTVSFYADGGAGNCSTLGGTITSTPTIAANGVAVACAVVTVASANAPGQVDFNFRAVSPITGAADTIHDAVTVNTVRSLTFTTSNSGQASIGGVVYYTHVIKNTGNVTEGGTASSIALAAANNQAGWTSVLYYDAAGTGTYTAADPVISVISSAAGAGLPTTLAPNQSITIFDKVTVPASSADGVINVTTLTVTTANGTYTTTVPAALSNTDTTTVVAGNVTLVKTQALDAACGGTASGFSSQQISAQPGACVTYQITVQNIGSTNATTVNVSDATPAYTTMAAKPTPALTPAISGVTVTSPAAGTTGTVSVTIPTLAPGQTEVLTFGVQIQQ